MPTNIEGVDSPFNGLLVIGVIEVIKEKEMWMPTNIEGVDSPFGSDGRLLLLPGRQPQLVQLHQSDNQRYYHKSDYYYYYQVTKQSQR